jgi:hypothetical protein
MARQYETHPFRHQADSRDTEIQAQRHRLEEIHNRRVAAQAYVVRLKTGTESAVASAAVTVVAVRHRRYYDDTRSKSLKQDGDPTVALYKNRATRALQPLLDPNVSVNTQVEKPPR